MQVISPAMLRVPAPVSPAAREQGGRQYPALLRWTVVSLPDGRRLIVDAVMNEASSINSRVVANLDIRAANDDTISQRIIYDDDEGWSAADLNLLQVGAPAVPFSRSREVIERVASVG